MDPTMIDRIRFHSRMMNVASKLGLAVEGGGELYRDILFDGWVESGKPGQDAWIRDALRSDFVWMSEPPEWIYTASSWPFFEGRPMVFLKQFSIVANDVTRDRAAPDCEVYVFAARRVLEDGFELITQNVTQSHALAKNARYLG